VKMKISGSAVLTATLALGLATPGSAEGINCPPGTIFIGGHHCRPTGPIFPPVVRQKSPVIDLPGGGKKGGQGPTNRQ